MATGVGTSIQAGVTAEMTATALQRQPLLYLMVFCLLIVSVCTSVALLRTAYGPIYYTTVGAGPKMAWKGHVPDEALYELARSIILTLGNSDKHTIVDNAIYVETRLHPRFRAEFKAVMDQEYATLVQSDIVSTMSLRPMAKSVVKRLTGGAYPRYRVKVPVRRQLLVGDVRLPIEETFVVFEAVPLPVTNQDLFDLWITKLVWPPLQLDPSDIESFLRSHKVRTGRSFQVTEKKRRR